MDVKTLDFSLFSNENPHEQQIFAKELVRTLSQLGFVKLVNHGIPESMLHEAFEWSRRFFALPLERKMKAPHPAEGSPHRGYTFVGQETTSFATDFEKGQMTEKAIFDFKESYDIGSTTDPDYANIWVDDSDLPGFQAFMNLYYQACHGMHMQVLQALARGLDVGDHFFESYCNQNVSELRLNHYPACDIQKLRSGANRISQHTDSGALTLLFQDSVGGLEVEDQRNSGRFIPVPSATFGEMIINVGDSLQRWTNDKLRSAVHKVTLPKLLKNPNATCVDSRFSIAYFGKPEREVDCGVLEPFIVPGIPLKYQHMTAWEYNQSKQLRLY